MSIPEPFAARPTRGSELEPASIEEQFSAVLRLFVFLRGDTLKESERTKRKKVLLPGSFFYLRMLDTAKQPRQASRQLGSKKLIELEASIDVSIPL